MRFFTLLFCFAATLLTAQSNPTKVITGTILLNSKQCPDFNKIKAELPSNWYVRVDSSTISDKTAVFSTPGATVMLAYLDYPVTPDEISIAAGISWLWKDAAKETKGHKAQLVISILGDESATVELYRIFTRVAAGSLASIDNTPGVYMNNQYLLLAKGYYLESARNMGRDGLPVYCWVYFGILQGETNSGYTFGLSEFGHHELELVNVNMPLQDSHSLLYELTQKAITVPPFKNGQQVALSDGKNVTITISTAQLIRDGSQTAKVGIIK